MIFAQPTQGGTSKAIAPVQVAESGGVKRLPAGDSLACAASTLVGPSQQVGSDRPEWCPRSSNVPLWIPAAMIGVGVLGLVMLCLQ